MKLVIALSVLTSYIFSVVDADIAANNAPVHKLVRDSLEELFGKEEALTYRCELQCHCEKCSEENTAFKAKCDELLPKRKIPNCKCPEVKKCPDPEHLDENCMLYCFCKTCKDDPRMIPEFADHCNSSTDWVQTCDCSHMKDCHVLDMLQNFQDKRGKLKSEQYDREL